MHPFRDAALCLLSLALAGPEIAVAGGLPRQAQERDRTKIPDQFKWRLSDIYPSAAEWKKAKDALAGRISSVEKYRGTLQTSPGALLECFSEISKLSKEYSRLAVYAGLSSDLDTRVSENLAMVQEMSQLGSELAAHTAYVQPEVLKMGRETIEAYLKKEPGLSVFRHDLDDILRRKDHTGTTGEEKIIADASLMADGPDNIYGIFSNADFPFPDVTLSDGKSVRLDKAAFNLYRAVPNREDRKKVFSAYLSRLDEYRRTFGTQLYAEVKKDLFFAKARKYATCLESALDGSNIPVEVYRSLVNNVNANLATFHRYLKLRQRLLGLDQLHYYDLYAPLVKNLDVTYSYDDAEKHVLAALAPLGKDYLETARKGLADRWVDVYPSTGKRAGAYSDGSAYDVHPYMLLNYNGKYEDVSTLAHELGHTMHSYLTNKAQPYPTSQYSIFVAEVASTFNEALLMDHMLKNMKDDESRLSLLGNYLDNLKGTLFRQVQFAEFELRIHEMAEKGETLTGDGLDALYAEITKKYYGHDRGICIVDDEVKAEWANVPHFYYNFYVFQYATSFTASTALSEEVLAGDKAATARYLDLLRAGGSDYPVALLKKAGVDMTTSQPFDLTMKKMNRVMDEVEEILSRRK
jgi:oligoendopeptidase F